MNDDWKAAFLLNTQVLLHTRTFSQQRFVIFPGKSHARQRFALCSWNWAQAGVSWEACVGNKNKMAAARISLVRLQPSV